MWLLLIWMISISESPRPAFASNNVRVPAGSCASYLSVTQTRKYLRTLAEEFPKVFRYPIEIGKSVQGRALEVACMGRQCPAESIKQAMELPPESLFTGLHHAREPISMMTVVYFAETVLLRHKIGDPAASALLADRVVWLYPIVNPDGYAANCRDTLSRMVRTNMRHSCKRLGNGGPGIDLNRNYPTCFSRHDAGGASTNPCTEDYQGPEPFSEPETRSIRDLTDWRNISLAINYHSYGREMTMPFGCEAMGKPKGRDMLIFKGIGKRIVAKNGYMFGVGWEKPLDLYTVDGAAQDWLYKERGIFALMAEVGPNYTPVGDMKPYFWPIKDQEKIGSENTEANMLMAWLSGPMLEIQASAVNTESVTSISATVTNTGVMAADDAILVLLQDREVLSMSSKQGKLLPYSPWKTSLRAPTLAACNDKSKLWFTLATMGTHNGYTCLAYHFHCPAHTRSNYTHCAPQLKAKIIAALKVMGGGRHLTDEVKRPNVIDNTHVTQPPIVPFDPDSTNDPANDYPAMVYGGAVVVMVVALVVMVLGPIYTCYILPFMKRNAQYQPVVVDDDEDE